MFSWKIWYMSCVEINGAPTIDQIYILRESKPIGCDNQDRSPRVKQPPHTVYHKTSLARIRNLVQSQQLRGECLQQLSTDSFLWKITWLYYFCIIITAWFMNYILVNKLVSVLAIIFIEFKVIKYFHQWVWIYCMTIRYTHPHLLPSTLTCWLRRPEKKSIALHS